MAWEKYIIRQKFNLQAIERIEIEKLIKFHCCIVLLVERTIVST